MTNDERKTFLITYTDDADFGCPNFTMKIRAYNEEHAIERFFDSDDDGWKIVSVKVAR